jgi:hypothetical protein
MDTSELRMKCKFLKIGEIYKVADLGPSINLPEEVKLVGFDLVSKVPNCTAISSHLVKLEASDHSFHPSWLGAKCEQCAFYDPRISK